MIDVSGIYMIRNTVNGKTYIGSSLCTNNRWRQHRQSLDKNNHKNPHLQSSWNKYGQGSFSFQVLEETIADDQVLLDREAYWIDFYKSFETGYNLIKDPSRPSRSEETRKKMSLAQMGNKKGLGRAKSAEEVEKMRIALTGQKRTKETCEKIRVAKKGIKRPEGFGEKMSLLLKGKTRSEETCRKISLARTGKKYPRIKAAS